MGASRERMTTWLLCLLVLLVVQAGCASTSGGGPYGEDYGGRHRQYAPEREPAPVWQAAHLTVEQPVSQISTFAELRELSVESLVEAVLARNPTLAEMVAVQQAAAARYPQVTALDDPMVGAIGGPAAWGSRDVKGGYRLEIAQGFPWPGKRALRGVNAAAEASAAANDVEATKLELVEAASAALADLYLATRALEVNQENLRLLREFRENAETRYATGQTPQQDVLQADVTIGQQKERQVMLERMQQVAVARINTLLHLAPDAPLPPPPVKLAVGTDLPAADVLRALALSRRPNLRALADRIAAERASLALARREYYPDVEVMAGYDAFWQEQDLRPMVGLRLNLPLRLDRRAGAVTEAEARLARRQAEYARRVDEVNFEVQQAYAEVRESRRVVRLFEDEILPAAAKNVMSARTSYVTGQIPFLTLVEAQREHVRLRDRYHAAVSDHLRRRAGLERAVGGPIPGAASLSALPTIWSEGPMVAPFSEPWPGR